jgi:hypothetical protein
MRAEQHVDVVEGEGADVGLVQLVERLPTGLALGDTDSSQVARQVEVVDLPRMVRHADQPATHPW